MTILAHRGNIAGPDPRTENSLLSCQRALECGFGLEIDLRRDREGRFYISHDQRPWSAAIDLAPFAALFKRYSSSVVAVNVKELGYEAELVSLQLTSQFGRRSFYFDFELLEPDHPGRTQRCLCSLSSGKHVVTAARLSDRDEPLEQCLSSSDRIVWADEFDSFWLKESDVQSVHAENKKFFVISPEIHGFDDHLCHQRWADFKSWKVDGLCTDYCLTAMEFFLH